MPTTSRVPADTSSEAAALQEQLLAEMTPGDRLRICLEMSDAVHQMTMDGIRSRHPDLSEDEVRERFAEVVYGATIRK